MEKKVSLTQVKQDAEAYFRAGEFYCSEAVVASLQKNIDPAMPNELIAAASGFPQGVGGSRCICGAVSGGVIALGYFFGRTAPGTPQDPAIQTCMQLANELQQSFRLQHHGVLCCSVQIRGLAPAEHLAQCAAFTGEMAAKTAEIIAQKLQLELVD